MYRLQFQSGRNKGKRLLVRQSAATVGSARSCAVRLREKECPWAEAYRLEKREAGVVPVALEAGEELRVNGRAVREGAALAHGDVVSAGGLAVQYQEIIPPGAPRLKPGGGVAQTLATLAILLIVGTELALLAFTAEWPKHLIDENVERLDIAYAERQRELRQETEEADGKGKEKKTDASSIIVMPGASLTEGKKETGEAEGAEENAAEGAVADAAPGTEGAEGKAPAAPAAAGLPEELREALAGADFAPAEIGDLMAGLPEVAAYDPVKENIESLLTEAKAAAQFSDYPRAFMLLNQIHQLAPGYLPAHMYHARLLEARGDLDAAYRRWRQLLGLVGKEDPEHAEIMQAGRNLQQRLKMLKTVSGHAGVDPETLPRLVKIADPSMQKMPADKEIAEMRILRGKVEGAAGAEAPEGPLQLYVTFYDQEPGGRVVPTRALVSPSPLNLQAGGANSAGTVPFEATYIVPAVLREGTQEPMPHASVYHGYTLHLFAGGVLQDAFARPARLLELPIHVAAPAGGG